MSDDYYLLSLVPDGSDDWTPANVSDPRQMYLIPYQRLTLDYLKVCQFKSYLFCLHIFLIHAENDLGEMTSLVGAYEALGVTILYHQAESGGKGEMGRTLKGSTLCPERPCKEGTSSLPSTQKLRRTLHPDCVLSEWNSHKGLDHQLYATCHLHRTAVSCFLCESLYEYQNYQASKLTEIFRQKSLVFCQCKLAMAYQYLDQSRRKVIR